MGNESNSVNSELARELILHVCHKMENDCGFGTTVLYKTLYYIDCRSFLDHGQVLTGLRYIKQQFGPTPLPAEFFPLRQQLLQANSVEERKVDFRGKQQNRLFAKVRPNLAVFTLAELDLIDSVIEVISGHTGKSISDLSHDELSWKLAGMMEEIPPHACLITEAEFNQADLDWAKKGIDDYSSRIH